MWSNSRPGVHTRMFIPFLSLAFSDLRFSPPIKQPGTTHWKGWNEYSKIICLKAKLKWWIVQVIWFHFHVYHDMSCCLTFFVKDILLTFTSLLNVSKHWMTNWNWTEMRYQWKSFSSLKKYILRSILILDLPPLLEQWQVLKHRPFWISLVWGSVDAELLVQQR